MSSGFVTEKEAVEARKRRQEEWEKVRAPDQPIERPEEPYDGRCLFDRLKEQKMKKDLEYDEAHKLKNLIRGLDDDEVQFLELVDRSKVDAENRQMREEEQELKEFRNRVATLQEECADKRIQSEIKQTKAKLTAANSNSRPTQKSLLNIGIKRKNSDLDAGTAPKAAKSADNNIGTDAHNKRQLICVAAKSEEVVTDNNLTPPDNNIGTYEHDKGQLVCVAILPGIGTYTESSDSELSSGSDDSPDIQGGYDLVGRKRNKKKTCQDE